MGREDNLRLITGLLEAIRDRDEERFAAAYAPDATARMAGVPRGLGGLLEGRDAIVENFHRQPSESVEVRLVFGDDEHACVVGKRSSTMATTQYFKGNDKPYTAYECIVFRFRDGLVREQTTYVNWLDVYVQTGVVDLAGLVEA